MAKHLTYSFYFPLAGAQTAILLWDRLKTFIPVVDTSILNIPFKLCPTVEKKINYSLLSIIISYKCFVFSITSGFLLTHQLAQKFHIFSGGDPELPAPSRILGVFIQSLSFKSVGTAHVISVYIMN